MKKRAFGIVAVVILVALVLNAVIVGRTLHSAHDFGGGHAVALDGPDLNVREYGPSGDRAIVLLHGYTASIEWWEKVAPKLAEAGHRVVVIDLVGHGGSESPGDDDAYGAAGQASAVDRALDSLGIKHAVLIGHSMGGHIATALAERHPDVVERIVVVDTFGDKGLRDIPAMAEVGCAPVVGELIDRFRGVDSLTRRSLQTGFADDYDVPDFAFRSLEQMTHRGVCNSDGGDELNEERPVAQRLAGLGKPVLVVWGGRDVLTPTDENVDRYTEAGLPPHVIDGSGHSPMIEKPDDFLAVVLPFVSATSR